MRAFTDNDRFLWDRALSSMSLLTQAASGDTTSIDVGQKKIIITSEVSCSARGKWWRLTGRSPFWPHVDGRGFGRGMANGVAGTPGVFRSGRGLLATALKSIGFPVVRETDLSRGCG